MVFYFIVFMVNNDDFSLCLGMMVIVVIVVSEYK